MTDQNKLKFTLISLDAITVAASWLAAYGLRYLLNEPLGNPINPFATYLYATPVIVALWLTTNSTFGLYSNRRGVTRNAEWNLLLKSTWIGLLVISSLAFFFREFEFARIVIGFSAVLSLISVALTRTWFRRVEARWRASGHADVRTLIVGAGMTGARALQKIQDHPEIGYHVVGFLDDDPNKANLSIGKAQVLGTLKDFRKTVTKHKVHEVILAIPAMPHEKILAVIMEAEDLDIRFRVISDLFGVLATEGNLDLIEDFPIFELNTGKSQKHYEKIKRFLDLSVCLLVAPVALVLHGFIALAIRLDSPGPALFTQDRVGRYGENFRMFKYRTMHADSPRYAVAPKEGTDPRITRVGGFLRKTSLDELPNLINVFKGEMSLVGPRPEMPFIVATYEDWQLKRLDAKPGVTGLWQILGRKDLPLHENLEYDFYYIKNKSIFLDLSILWRTFAVVVSRKGAY